MWVVLWNFVTSEEKEHVVIILECGEFVLLVGCYSKYSASGWKWELEFLC